MLRGCHEETARVKFKLMRADRQTNRQTDTDTGRQTCSSQYSAPHSGRDSNERKTTQRRSSITDIPSISSGGENTARGALIQPRTRNHSPEQNVQGQSSRWGSGAKPQKAEHERLSSLRGIRVSTALPSSRNAFPVSENNVLKTNKTY